MPYLTCTCYHDLLRWWSYTKEIIQWDEEEPLEEDGVLVRLIELLPLSQLCELEHSLRACDDAALAEEVHSLVYEIADTVFETADEERARYLENRQRSLCEQYDETGAETIVNAAAAVARIVAESFDDPDEDSYAKVRARANRLIDAIPQILKIIDEAME
jgi:hypothetical protein